MVRHWRAGVHRSRVGWRGKLFVLERERRMVDAEKFGAGVLHYASVGWNCWEREEEGGERKRGGEGRGGEIR